MNEELVKGNKNVINKKLQVHGLVSRKNQPTFNQDGNQLIINFEDLKKKVEEKKENDERKNELQNGRK